MFGRRTDFASVAKLCSTGEVDALSNVLLKKPRMVEDTSKTGATLLHIACHRGRLDICIVLLLKGAKIDSVDDMGFTPLMVCTQFRQSDCARMLIARGAEVGMVNKRGQEALHIAAIFGSSDIIPPLLDNGAQINGVDNDGCTAVMLAAGRCLDSVVALLVKYDCNVLIEDKYNNSALSLARENGLHVSTVNSIVFHRELQMVEVKSRQQAAMAAKMKKLSPKSNLSTGGTQRSQGKTVTFEGEGTVKGAVVPVEPAPTPVPAPVPEPEAKLSPKVTATTKKKKGKKGKNKTVKGEKQEGEEENRATMEQKSLEEADRREDPNGDGAGIGEEGLQALHASEGNIAAIMMELNNAKDSGDSPAVSNKDDGGSDGKDKDIMASLAAQEMERRLQIVGLRDPDDAPPLPAAVAIGTSAGDDDNGDGGKGADRGQEQGRARGGLAPDFEGSAVSSLTMNSLASHVLQKKRNRERDIARRNGHLSPPVATNTACWNPVGCLDDQSVGQIQTATDLWLLYKAEEARGNAARAQYLKNLAMQKDEEEKEKRAAAAAAKAKEALRRAEEAEAKAKAKAKADGGGGSLDYLWCLSPIMEDEKTITNGKEDIEREKRLLADAYAGPPGERVLPSSEQERGLDEGKGNDDSGGANKQQLTSGVDGNDDEDGDDDEDEDEDELPNLGQWVPSNTTRKIDPNRPISKADMMKRKRRIKKREQKQEMAARMLCTEAPPPDRNRDSSKDDMLIRARANEASSHNSADDASCSIV